MKAAVFYFSLIGNFKVLAHVIQMYGCHFFGFHGIALSNRLCNGTMEL